VILAPNKRRQSGANNPFINLKVMWKKVQQVNPGWKKESEDPSLKQRCSLLEIEFVQSFEVFLDSFDFRLDEQMLLMLFGYVSHLVELLNFAKAQADAEEEQLLELIWTRFERASQSGGLAILKQ